MIDSVSLMSPLLWGAVALAIILFVWLVRVHRGLNLHKAHARQQKRALEKDVEKCNKQLLEVRSVLVGLGQKVSEQEEIIAHLTERIIELENVDSDGRLYTRANKMVKLGADINELIEECELPKAEAELMLSLQNKIAGKEKVPPLHKAKQPIRAPASQGYSSLKKSR
ncbi:MULTISPECIES: DUF2802 domain-containing protein [Vibrio]|uniref:DUF2802 domain-containing protein n=1 Tax=Vibrio mediterranei TaxID=689 RepID=A0ABX5D9Q8_9VIBR|nr:MULTISPECIES: DUF2802 domain-containing protein [Vibrio]MCG9662287.1 DUF2802 domain-containing protein [Vibrio mediterranei]NOI22166.1 DUF2802 domain-containing protein [Vibrio mediterranei]PCD88818.1 DUF2802 domain-containing protein [Vibrio mediterranei]PRQ66417.1 DUF2802 domain-containing protein [Vibrio mediterranei]SBO09662.1 hypothetical protein VME0621_01764 [Vibrio mediterranei]